MAANFLALRVLVVDDDVLIGWYGKASILAHAGHTVVEAADGAAAIRALRMARLLMTISSTASCVHHHQPEEPMPNIATISGRTGVYSRPHRRLERPAALCGAGAQDVPARPPLVGAEWVHTAIAGESSTTIGAREGITPEVLAARNGRALKSPSGPATSS